MFGTWTIGKNHFGHHIGVRLQEQPDQRGLRHRRLHLQESLLRRVGPDANQVLHQLPLPRAQRVEEDICFRFAARRACLHFRLDF